MSMDIFPSISYTIDINLMMLVTTIFL